MIAPELATSGGGGNFIPASPEMAEQKRRCARAVYVLSPINLAFGRQSYKLKFTA
jgi:hypothetical protein